MGVVVMFIMSVIFSIGFPTTDYGSDIYLAYQTINFFGDNQVLQGCRICFHKDAKDMLERHEERCVTCVSFLPFYDTNNDGATNPSLFKPGETLYTFSFASNKCGITITDKILELESSSDQCNEQIQEVEHNDSFTLETKKECGDDDHCCIKRTKKVEYPEFDKEIEWDKCIRNNHGCEMCVGAGALTMKSCYYLQDIGDPDKPKSKPISNTSYPWHVKDKHCDSTQTTTFYRINDLMISGNELLHVSWETGRCLKDDQCCVEFRHTYKSDKQEDEYDPKSTAQCYDDICKRHLHVVSYSLNRTVDINDWKKMNIYNAGRDFGGRLCGILQTYGWSVLIPVSFFYAFGFVLCYNDINSGKASRFEYIFAVVSLYPQWVVIRLFIRYAKGNINEEELIEEKGLIDGSVTSIEPFVESCFQV